MVKPTYDYLEGELFMHKHQGEDIELEGESDRVLFNNEGTIDSSDIVYTDTTGVVEFPDNIIIKTNQKVFFDG